jgi:hypothetical protein
MLFGMPPNPEDLKHRVEALQSNIAGLFKLLGSHDPDERLRFWEILKGITTPAEFRLVEHQLGAINALVTQAEVSTKTLVDAARIAGKAGH